MLFVSKQKQVEQLISEYSTQVRDNSLAFHKAITDYLKGGTREQLTAQFTIVHKAESRADDIRREVEVLMYTKSIFPESRGDILGLLEAIDNVPNQVENTLRMICTHFIAFPKEFNQNILELSELTHRCTETLLESLAKLFTDFTNATVAIGKVDELESQIDAIQYHLYEQIFSSTLDGFQKILLRDAIKAISSISDRAENAADRIRLIVAKRRV